MANKRQLHHFWTKIRPISEWYFLVIFVVCAVVAVIALRQNNLTALKLRDQVVAADKANGDVETAIRQLRQFIYSHENTNLSTGPNAIKPPLQLKYRYDRLVQAAKDQASATNAKIYTDAQAYCEQKIPNGLSGGGRVPCIQDYVSSHGVKETPIAEDLYKFDFVSPLWAPDLAGLSLLAAAVALLLFIIRFILARWLHHELS